MQPSVWKTVELGPWLATPVLPSAEVDRRILPADGIELTARLADGRKLWSAAKNLADGKVVEFVAGSASDAVCLGRSIRAWRPARLTVGVGGGDRLDVWLNGRKVASGKTHLNFGRYGCATRVDGTRVDQLLVDLDLSAGENTLLIRLTPAPESSFFFSASPSPVPRLWEQVRGDYAAAQNPLLELVHADWFATDGWFAAKDSALEEKFIERLSANCGDDKAELLLALNRLREDKTDLSDRAWLDLCVKASVLAKLRGDLSRLRAAVHELGKLFPDEYPMAESLGSLEEYEKQLSAQAGVRLDPADDATLRLLAEMPQMRRRLLVDRNPLLRRAEILFVKRYTYNSKHYYDDFQHISRCGGNLCVLSLADGSDLRQVTRPPADEADRIATYGKTSTGDGFYGLMGYRFWTDDVHPCYLPGGGLCFASTRSEHGVLCTPNHYLACTNRFRMDCDGGGLRPISQGALSEFTPTMMEDGRILYNRWEYVYKGIAAVQPLWSMRPDGSGSEEFYGDNIANPGVFWQARQVLVSCNPDNRYNDQSAYGIYLLDAFGNRVPLYDDPEISCWQPMPLRPRQSPPLLASVADELPQREEAERNETATVFLSDVYRGLEGVESGTVKYIRVMEQVPKPWAAEVDPLRGEDRGADGFGGHIAVSCNAHIWIAVLVGIAPVEEDGSACFEVPAGRNLFFQALDEEFMEMQRMRTFVSFELVTCGIRPRFPLPPKPDPLPAKLLAWWPLDESAPGAATDASGHDHKAKVVGTAVSKGSDGRGARRFDGNGYMEAASLGKHEALSIAMWVKVDSLGNQWNPLLFCHGGQAGAMHFSLLSDSTPNVAVNTGDWNWTHCKARSGLGDGNWHHLVLVCDARSGGQARFYVDGRIAGQQHLGVGLRLDLYRFRIGGWDRWEDKPANNFHGAIDDVRIYSGMLTDKQAAGLAGQR